MSTIATRNNIATLEPTPSRARGAEQAAELQGSMPAATTDTLGTAIRQALGAVSEFVSDAQSFIAGKPSTRFPASLGATDRHVVKGLLRHLEGPLEALKQVGESVANGTLSREQLEKLVDAIKPVSSIIPKEALKPIYNQLR